MSKLCDALENADPDVLLVPEELLKDVEQVVLDRLRGQNPSEAVQAVAERSSDSEVLALAELIEALLQHLPAPVGLAHGENDSRERKRARVMQLSVC